MSRRIPQFSSPCYLSPRATVRGERLLRVELLEQRTLLTVASLLPDANSHDADPSTDIRADFTQPIDAGTVDDQTFAVHAHQTGRLLSINGDITSLTGSGTQVTFNPAADFHAGELVQVTITDGLEQSGGGSVGGPFVWQFRTATTAGPGEFFDSGQTLGDHGSLRGVAGRPGRRWRPRCLRRQTA